MEDLLNIKMACGKELDVCALQWPGSTNAIYLIVAREMQDYCLSVSNLDLAMHLYPLSWSFRLVEVGMTRLCYMSNIIGRKHVKRNNHTNFCGIRWTEKYETRTTSTGRSIFLRLPAALSSELSLKNRLL